MIKKSKEKIWKKIEEGQKNDARWDDKTTDFWSPLLQLWKSCQISNYTGRKKAVLILTDDLYDTLPPPFFVRLFTLG